ncbi:MAG: tripartite tricarboxylate transporter TctB family protein [Marinosulfonomonas sp.]
MSTSADRASGAFFLFFGLALYFWVIPTYVEDAAGGSITPKLMPDIYAIILAASGALLILKPTQHQTQDLRYFATTFAYVAVLALGIYATSLFGFEFVAPVLALVIMWMIGERRPLWLISGVILMPALIWFLVTFVLGRALP